MATFYATSGSFENLDITGSLYISGTFTTIPGLYVDNLITVGLPGSSVAYNSIKAAVDSITDASQNNTYTVQVSPGIYIEDTITVPSWVAVKGDSSISTVVSASNPNNSIFIMSDQSMIIDMQIQGSTGTGATAVLYSSATTPQLNAIAYAENIRFGSNYTHAKTLGVPGGNCILQCSNVKYGGATANNKSFDIGFQVTGSGGGIGRMQLRNVTSTNGGVTGSADQIFALADAPGCTFIVNGCLLTKATGTALGTGFKVYNGGSLRLTSVNFQRWGTAIYAPNTGSAPSIFGSALNFENNTYDILIEHPSASGHLDGADTFLKTVIPINAPIYEVNQDPRIITVGTKGADFTSISASVAYITDSAANNRYVIQVGPGQFTEKEIDLTNKPYVSIVGSSIQTTQIFPSASNQHLIKMGVNNEVSFLTLTNAPTGYSALYVDDVGDFAQAHKVSFYDCDTCLTVISRTQDTKFYGEYMDYNGTYRTGSYVSSSNGFQALASLENYYQFPASAPGLIANYGTGDVAELDLYTGALIGELDTDSVAIRLENGADLQATAFDIPRWGTAVYMPNLANSASFNIVGSMIHDSVNYDFNIQHPSSSCRFQGTADHSKINTPNTAPNFFWTFLDETDGALDITRNLAVTFEDGTNTDASTLIFRGSPMGVMQGGQITDPASGDLDVDVAAGFGYLETATEGIYKRIDWNGPQTIALNDDSENYIFVDSDGNINAAPVEPDNLTKIILGRVYAASGSVQFVDQSPRNAYHTSNLLSTFNRTALGPVFAQGSTVTANGTNRLDVSSDGIYFFGENQFTPTGGTSVLFDRYYRNTTEPDGWSRTSTADVPINQWDSGSNALVALSASYYTKHTLYLIGDGAEEKYFLVTGQQQFSTLVATENANLATPPNYFIQGVVPIAAVYVQSGSGITQIEDIRPIIGFRAGGVNAASYHGNLLGLENDDHKQYLLVSGSRPMYAPLTASIISASSEIIGNLTGTASYATGSIFNSNNPALSASYALTASYALSSPGGSGNIAISAGSVSNNLSSIVFANSNNVNFGLNGSTITANAPIAISAGTLSSNVSSLVFSNSNGVSFGLNGNTITATVAAGAANITVSAGTATNAVSSLVFSNSNNISFGLNGSTITATAASSLTNINISAGVSSNNLSALVFSNSNGVSFGLNGSTVTATANGSGIQAAGGGSTNTVSQLVFSNSNNISFGLNGSTVTATAGAAGVTVDYYNPYPFYPLVQSTYGATAANGTILLQPVYLSSAVSFDRVMVALQYSNASNSSNSVTYSYYWGIYTDNANTLSLLSSVSTSWNISNSGTAGSYSLYAGLRNLSLGLTGTLTAGEYYVGAFSRVSSNAGGMSLSNLVASNLNSNFSGIMGVSSAATNQSIKGLGIYSAATAAFPNNISFNQIFGTPSFAIKPQAFYLAYSTI